MNRRRLVVLSGTLAALAGCRSGPATSHTTIAGDSAPLRDSFNADSGKVRAIFLASPT